MIELTDDQKKAVAAAQTRFSNLKENADNLSKDQIDLLFGEARSMNGWQDKNVSDDIIKLANEKFLSIQEAYEKVLKDRS